MINSPKTTIVSEKHWQFSETKGEEVFEVKRAQFT
jgi:hypothetical protein